MKTLEQQVKDLCTENNYFYWEDEYKVNVEACDKRVFHTGNHWVTAHVGDWDWGKGKRLTASQARNKALRFLIEEMTTGGGAQLPESDDFVCGDEHDCEYCNEQNQYNKKGQQ